jgi:archaeosine synthase
MASGRIIPKYYPVLIYLGVDLIDCSYLLFLSAENFYDTIEYLLPIYKVKYLPCSCLACKGNLNYVAGNKYSAQKIDLLSLHNLITANNYMRKIKQYLNYEDFRAFVEKSSFDETNLISILKILDKDYFDYIKYETPITQKGKKIRCFGSLSYNRPDFQQFREIIIKHFEPEPWTTLIILLPCSAKKPYSKSKSHKLFYNVIRKFSEFPNFQEFILTSPLGVIPRQLENVYPVNSYDISVTGEWDDEEINITAEMLVKTINKYDKRIPILCHLKNGYLEIVKRASSKLPHNFIFSEIYGKTTSIESLQSLENLIKEYSTHFKTKKKDLKEYFSKTWTRKFIKLLDYQFGIGSGVKIISNGLQPSRVRSNDQIDLKDLKTQEKLGVFRFSTGQVQLTITGIKRLFQSPHSIDSNYIVFDGEEINGNTLFRTGVLNYSSDLIPGNQVFILDKGKKNIIGSGELIAGSNFLKNSKSGRIAKINEKK